MYEVVRRLCTMRDKVMRFWIGSKMMIFVTDATMVEQLLIKCSAKDVDFYGAFSLLADGIFIHNGKRWSELRRPLDKMFHPKLIETDYYVVFVRNANILCDIFDSKCGKGVFDVDEIMKYCTLDIVMDTIFGVPGSTQMLDNTLNLPNLIAKVVQGIFQKMFKLEYKFDWIFNMSKIGKRTRKNQDGLRLAWKKIQEIRKKEWAETGVHPSDPDFVPTNYVDLVHQVAYRDNWTEEHLEMSIFDLVAAGYDTSSIAASTAILFLAMYPEYQEKAYQEQVEIMGDRLEAPTPEEVERMDYLTMVFYDTLRHVGVPAIARTVTTEVTVEGYVFPVGSTINFASHEVGMNPNYYERPKEFYPDHFLPEKVAKRPKGAFFPFSGGARSCPGKKFSHLSVKIILSMLIRRFKFTTDMTFSDLTYKYMLMLESVKGYPVEATRRTSTN
ncbi:hypothetical protein GE061_010398 [Apolygus lucorum]|uniref:Cytochrome P450 n=1 Tax=Apolygus lucorum TaxID=248454 RepID=A0A8S9Y2W4_APOLU|nr:hypothetical protein GE061_010398 [Apolygus lucorum]